MRKFCSSTSFLSTMASATGQGRSSTNACHQLSTATGAYRLAQLDQLPATVFRPHDLEVLVIANQLGHPFAKRLQAVWPCLNSCLLPVLRQLLVAELLFVDEDLAGGRCQCAVGKCYRQERNIRGAAVVQEPCDRVESRKKVDPVIRPRAFSQALANTLELVGSGLSRERRRV